MPWNLDVEHVTNIRFSWRFGDDDWVEKMGDNGAVKYWSSRSRANASQSTHVSGGKRVYVIEENVEMRRVEEIDVDVL
ncbi:hypothetical protein Tco_0073501 [Tanacetum coccineum]